MNHGDAMTGKKVTRPSFEKIKVVRRLQNCVWSWAKELRVGPKNGHRINREKTLYRPKLTAFFLV